MNLSSTNMADLNRSEFNLILALRLLELYWGYGNQTKTLKDCMDEINKLN